MGKYNLNTLMYKLLTTLCSTRKKKREHSCRHERTEYTRGFYHPTLNEHGTTSCLGTSLPYFESLQSELTANTNAKYFPGCQKYIKIRNYKIISASSYAKSLSTLIIHSSSPGGGPGITSPILVRSPLCQLLSSALLGNATSSLWAFILSLHEMGRRVIFWPTSKTVVRLG